MELPLCHETSACSLEVSALRHGSLPRPWGEGGRRPGEGQPTRIAPQNVQTLAAAVPPDLRKVCDFPAIFRFFFRGFGPELNEGRVGKSETFRASGGRAAGNAKK